MKEKQETEDKNKEWRALDQVPAISSMTSKHQQSNFKDFAEDEIFCTICATIIPGYVPKYFYGTEVNPASKDCQDSSYSEDDQNYVEEINAFTKALATMP